MPMRRRMKSNFEGWGAIKRTFREGAPMYHVLCDKLKRAQIRMMQGAWKGLHPPVRGQLTPRVITRVLG